MARQLWDSQSVSTAKASRVMHACGRAEYRSHVQSKPKDLWILTEDLRPMAVEAVEANYSDAADDEREALILAYMLGFRDVKLMTTAYVEPHNCEYLPVEGKRHHFLCNCGARLIGNNSMTAFKKVYA